MLEPKVVGVETVDHPMDGRLVAHVRAYFRAKDRVRDVALALAATERGELRLRQHDDGIRARATGR